jgi:hypothetical protein
MKSEDMDRDQLLELVARLRDRVGLLTAEKNGQRKEYETRMANLRSAKRLANKRADAAEEAMRGMAAQMQNLIAYKTPAGAVVWELLRRWVKRYEAVPAWSAERDMQILLDSRAVLAEHEKAAA